MPIGEYQYSLDDKGRVIIPPSFREFVADGMVITRGMDGCLFIFPTVKWSEIVTKLNDLSMMDPASRNFQRFFYSGASKAILDTAGRITLPSSLRTYAGLGDNAVIAGTPNHLEIWDEARWYALLANVETQPPTPELLQGLIG